jgi:PGF-CTERM protein
VGATGPVAATDHSTDEPAFIVHLEDDGDATVTLRLVYDLDADDERAAFADLRNDSAARTDLRDRFASRMRSVANETAAGADREMAIDDGSVDLTTMDDAGVAELSVHWTGLATTTDGSLVLSEPFASGFAPDRQFVVVAPEGYSTPAVTPEAAAVESGTAVWEPGTRLEGFELVLSPDDGSDASGTADAGLTSDSAPGFGVGTAIAALLSAAVALGRRR